MVTSSGKDDFTFTGFNYNNGTFNFRTCENAAAENPADIWLGDIYANDTRRVLSCGGLPGNHCLYFVREHVETPVGECMCREARKDGMVWPATQCGETQTIGCFSGADSGAMGERMIRIVFEGSSADEPTISDLAMQCHVAVNIRYADTREVSGKLFGQMILQLPEDHLQQEKAIYFLQNKGLRVEEVNGHVHG